MCIRSFLLLQVVLLRHRPPLEACTASQPLASPLWCPHLGPSRPGSPLTHLGSQASQLLVSQSSHSQEPAMEVRHPAWVQVAAHVCFQYQGQSAHCCSCSRRLCSNHP